MGDNWATWPALSASGENGNMSIMTVGVYINMIYTVFISGHKEETER